MAGMTTTDFDAMLKAYYVKPDSLQHSMMERSPLFGLLPKDENAGGKSLYLPILTQGNRKRSSTYATASANTQNTVSDEFVVPYRNNYQFARWTDDAMRDSRGKGERALLEAMEVEMDGAMSNLLRDIGQGMFGNLGGRKGVVGTTTVVGSALLTLSNAEDAIHFEKDDVLYLSADDGADAGDALRAGSVTVLSVDYDAGTVTMTGNITAGIAAAAVGDSIFHAGDFAAKYYGLGAWIPDTTTGLTTAFCGVTRSSNAVRLAGSRFNAGGLLPQELIARMAARIRRVSNDASPDLFVCNDETFADFAIAIEHKTYHTINAVSGDGKRLAKIGYEGIKVATPNGAVTMVADPNCPPTRAYMLTTDSWKLGSVGKAIHMIDDDGQYLRRGSADDWYVELKSRMNLGCRAPWKNGVALLDTAAS